MEKVKYPTTSAVRFLREKNIRFVPHLYPYEERGGTGQSARMLEVDEHRVIKTLVMETDNRKPFIILMHGDCEVSTKGLARTLEVKSVQPCTPETAQKHTGYQVGGTSPFGTRTPLDIYVEGTIFDLGSIYVNGGKRGFLVEIDPRDMRRVLSLREVEVAIVLHRESEENKAVSEVAR